MSKLNGKKLLEIEERIKLAKDTDNRDAQRLLVADAELMLGILNELRDGVHYTEDAEGFCLGVADTLGTNCQPGPHPE